MKKSNYINLSEDTASRIQRDIEDHWQNPYRSTDGDIIRRDPSHDIANVQRPAYVRDIEKIMNVPYYNRYSDKTQVFSLVRNDDISRRALHVQYVSRIARNIGRLLGLNIDLIEAIALGHDIGHTPFGHAGERALNAVCPGGFTHAAQSLRVVEVLEKNGEGLNLTREVRDGILNHRTSGSPKTLEGQIVRICDKIAYINHDIDDAERAGILQEEDIPSDLRLAVGDTTRKRLNTLIHDVVVNSEDQDRIRMSAEMSRAMSDLRKFMFERVYTDPVAKREETKAIRLVQELYHYYTQHPGELPGDYLQMMETRGFPLEQVVCDYIAGMTDPYSIKTLKELYIPQAWKD